MSHGVEPDQYERDPITGDPLPTQAHHHRVEMFLSNFDLSAKLGVRPWLGIGVHLPVRLVRTTASFVGGPIGNLKHGDSLQGFQSIHHRTETLAGVGDLELRLHFTIVRPRPHSGWLLALEAGLAFPTGGTSDNPYALGRAGLTHQHIFFGSGTFDPVARLVFGRKFRRWALLTWLDTRVAPYENRKGYQAGARVTGGIGAESGFGLRTWRFRLQTEVFHQEPARWNGARESEDGGRTDLLVGAGVRWQLHTRWALRLDLRVPITLRSVGANVRMPVMGTLAVDAAFKVF